MNAWKRKEVIGDCTLYLGDCLEVMPALGRFDAVVTDPPYGLGTSSGTVGLLASHKRGYQCFDDTVLYIKTVAVPAISKCISIAGVVVMTPGSKNAFEYPKPDAMGIFYQPAAMGMCAWGRTTSQPILFYGRDPRIGKTIQPLHYVLTEKPSTKKHPCAKPQKAWEWVCSRATIEGQHILDPFMGSGTTGVACAKMGRKFTGIELDPEYFQIACDRIQKAYDQPDMFVAPPKQKPEPQEVLL